MTSDVVRSIIYCGKNIGMIEHLMPQRTSHHLGRFMIATLYP